MKRKIRNVACGVAQKFAVSAEHFAFLARESGNHEVFVDLLTGGISPECFDIERNRIHVRRCVEFIKWHLDEIPGCHPASAGLVVTFSSSDSPGWCFKADFRVIITSHDGTTWHGEFHTPEQMIAC
ncbi:hypothetical protein [Fluviicoccus keumensis]|uniref:hypothetical protein n=1 Tax=Fluviicoccus keumensis TaxID=1435465 RepID=UPI00102C7E69|nr:hypothetical protein [Fluviicoccus keumensis]